MKRKIPIAILLVLSLSCVVMILAAGCKRDPVVPRVITATATNVATATAAAGGTITSDGGAEVTSRGVCWATSSNPVFIGSHTSDGKGSGEFISNLSELTPATTYYFRAYAVNKAGTGYGNELSFTTAQIVQATLTTTEISAITSSGAKSGGNITADGGDPVTVRGVCWSATLNPTTADSKTTDGEGPGSFVSDMTGLQPGMTYHVRAYATNSAGTSYGNDRSFSATAVSPVLTTSPIGSVTQTSAVSGGNITSDGGAPVTAHGVCWSTASNPVVSGDHSSDGPGSGAFESNVTGLVPGTYYYVRAYATNSSGTSYGNQRTFTSEPVQAPAVVTTIVSSVTLSSAISGGNITNDNGAPVTDRGICWNTTGNPSILGPKTSDGDGNGSFTLSISGLQAETIYYIRAYATNSVGTGYGSQRAFSTSTTDIDGNIYPTVIIGTQLWMQTNLKTTKLNDYTDILYFPYVPDTNAWLNLYTPAYCWYGDSQANRESFGGIYNWYTVETGKLCPSGWHVPTDNDFKILEIYLGMPPDTANLGGWRGVGIGTQLKSPESWDTGIAGTNSSGFTAKGGGYKFGVLGTYCDIGKVSYWWTSTLHWSDATKALYRRLDYDNAKVFREGVIKAGGKYVRCLKD